MKRGNEHSPIQDNTKKARFASGYISNYHQHHFSPMAPGMAPGVDAYSHYSPKNMVMGAGVGLGGGMAGVAMGAVGMAGAAQQQPYPLAAYQAALGQFSAPQPAFQQPVGQYFAGGAGNANGAVGLAGQQQQGGHHNGAGYQQNQYAVVAAAVAAQQAAATANQTGRTVYIGNIPAEVTIDQILDQVRCSGPIENARLLTDKSCAFLSFLDGQTAALFHQECQAKKLVVNNFEVKVGWGKPSPLPMSILMAAQGGATRNVFLGSLDESFTEERLREDLSRFGPIENIRLIREKCIGFVHFLSIQNAVKCVATLQSDPNYQGRRIYYGRDRCAVYQNKGNVHGGSHSAVQGYHPGSFQTSMNFSNSIQAPDAFQVSDLHNYPGQSFLPPGISDMGVAGGNRTVYLGNFHPDTTCEDICNVIRGGILYQIRYLPEKHIAFVTFVEPSAAANFCAQANYNGIVIKSRRLKVGWGKHLPIPAHILAAVQSGASRNVYLGGIDEAVTEEKLRMDFAEYGDIELVNILREKNCGFVNFTSITSAMKAVEGMRDNHEYAQYRINFGKDRCGNPPRLFKLSDRPNLSPSGGNPPPPGGPGNGGAGGMSGPPSPGGTAPGAPGVDGSAPGSMGALSGGGLPGGTQRSGGSGSTTSGLFDSVIGVATSTSSLDQHAAILFQQQQQQEAAAAASVSRMTKGWYEDIDMSMVLKVY